VAFLLFSEQIGVFNVYLAKNTFGMDHYEAQSCERCGKDVHCHGDLNCACVDLLIPEHVHDFIGATYDRCLCRACLLKLIAEME
jgi:hypothetical protein